MIIQSIRSPLSHPLDTEIDTLQNLIETISISPDRKWIATGSRDKTVRIWNVHDATLQCILHCPGQVWSVDFSPVGNYLAVGGYMDEVTIWNYGNL